jgi:hypothetical protein
VRGFATLETSAKARKFQRVEAVGLRFPCPDRVDFFSPEGFGADESGSRFAATVGVRGPTVAVSTPK